MALKEEALKLRKSCILAAIFALIILIQVYLFSVGLAKLRTRSTSRFEKSRLDRVKLPSTEFEKVSKTWPGLDTLIIVPGHAIQWCSEQGRAVTDEDCWYLMNYQRGQVQAFIEHIKLGAKLAAEDKGSLLVFSGGQTRPGMGPRSEGQSYFAVAEKMGLLSAEGLYDRSISEEFARDSLENLVFSMCRFRQVTGQMPQKVKVVGFPFKERRFVDLHRKAAMVLEGRFTYISVPESLHGIVDDAYEDFSRDLYGCGEKLSKKRMARNPYHTSHGYYETCPELRHILLKCITNK